MARGTFKSDEACREQWAKVSSVAELFERRWTRLALKRIDPMLAERLAAQQSLFDGACLHGSVGDIEIQGGGMARGWLAAIQAMEAADVPDDAYQLGSDPVSGLKVAIGHQKAAAKRVVELHGQDVVWITPDEVAMIVGSGKTGLGISAVKKQWPGAEIVRYGNEGT